MTRTGSALKRVLVGRPMSTEELEHTLLPKIIALPVFSSDPLSSNAYATQEILLVLGTVGVMSLGLVVPISLAVALLLATVVTSYRQTVRAYPTGGGAYRVARENIGTHAGLAAASALLLDYVLTVAVSVVAGVDAIISAAGSLAPYAVGLSILFVAFVTLANLRGVRESGTFFAIPTYGFVLSIFVLIVTGLLKCVGGCPAAESADLPLRPETTLSVFLILKAFAAGTTALTGVEAIADGVGAFRYPQSKNAASTLGAMGIMTIGMFLGISWLANHTGVHYVHEAERTVVAQIAHVVFGGGIMFYVVQVMTAGILVLAANTAFQDFPRLSSILAGDSFMPRQFRNRGDRLVFSNGIIILATMASVLIWIFDAELNDLIQLYLIGVFISFTLSQSGMVLRWRRLRTPGWRKSAAINGFGATVTGIVFFVIAGTKFTGGAWMILTAIPMIMFTMHSIRRHYDDVAQQSEHPGRRPPDLRPGNQHMIILVERVDLAVAQAVAYAHTVSSGDVTAITFDERNTRAWQELGTDMPLVVVDLQGSRVNTLRHYLRTRRAELDPDDFLTLMIPEVLGSRSLFEVIRRPRIHRMKAALLPEEGVQVLDIPIVVEDAAAPRDHPPKVAKGPVRHQVCILVSDVHNATRRAIEYAETLQASDVRAVSFALEPEESEKLGNEWLEAGIPHPLEIEDSPFRDIGRSLVAYLRKFNPDGVNVVVTVVIPERIVSKRRHQFLHGQNALIIKRHLLFEPGVVVVSVPYHIAETDKQRAPTVR
ncbi:MAG: APC family permease [Actinomycetota bacterium]